MAPELLSSPSMLTRTLLRALLVPLVVASSSVALEASSAEEKIRLGEISVPDPQTLAGVDRASLRRAAEGEIAAVDTARMKKRVIVSVAVSGASDRPSVNVSVDAALRDAKSGTILAVVQGRARAEGGACPELRQQVMRAAVKSALSQIPLAVAQ